MPGVGSRPEPGAWVRQRDEEQLRCPVVAGRPERVAREASRQRFDLLPRRIDTEWPPVGRDEFAQVTRDRTAGAGAATNWQTWQQLDQGRHRDHQERQHPAEREDRLADRRQDFIGIALQQ